MMKATQRMKRRKRLPGTNLQLTSSPCLADTTNHEKEPEMAGLLDRVRPRHLAAWRSSFAWSGCGDSQPDN